MNNIFGINLKKFREVRGLNQKEFAELLSKETTQSFNQQHISNYESTEIFPKPMVIPHIAKILGVTTDQLFGYNATAKEIDISEIIGVTRPELNRLSKTQLKMVFEKYLNYLDELIKSRELLVEKVHHLEAQIQLLKQESAEGPNNE